MKKLGWIIAVLILVPGAVCIFFYIQPKYCNLSINNEHFKIYFRYDMLYSKENSKYNKLIQDRILDFKINDIDYDGNDEIIAITKDDNSKIYGNDLVILNIKLKNGLLIADEIYRQDFSEVKPWKIDICNLDNDCKPDIFVGVYKNTKFYKEVRNRPFFYTWDGKTLHKKWQGSYFSKESLVDVAFGDFFNLGYDVAAVLEKNSENTYKVSFYNFTGFGFLKIGESKGLKNVRTIKTFKGNNRDYVELSFGAFKKIILGKIE